MLASNETISSIGHMCGIWHIPMHSGKEFAFMWSIWPKVVEIYDWNACIAPASIFKQCKFCLPSTSKLVKHKFEIAFKPGELEVGHFRHA